MPDKPPFISLFKYNGKNISVILTWIKFTTFSDATIRHSLSQKNKKFLNKKYLHHLSSYQGCRCEWGTKRVTSNYDNPCKTKKLFLNLDSKVFPVNVSSIKQVRNKSF